LGIFKTGWQVGGQKMSDTPETDAEHAQFAMGGFTLDFCRRLERERDEWKCLAFSAYDIVTDKCDLPNGVYDLPAAIDKLKRERDEARKKIKELIYIAERAIALAEINFENDKFGVVTELRDALEQIKEGVK
jgi:hypothetical protein